MFLLAAPTDLSAVVRIPVAYADGDGEAAASLPDALGDFGDRSPGGTATATRRGTAYRLPTRTRPLSLSEVPTVRAVLEDPAGIYVAGEWLELLTGGYLMPAHVGEIKQRHVSLAGGRHVVLSFELIQAGPIDFEAPDDPSAWWRGSLDVYEDLAATEVPETDADRVLRWDEQEAGGYSLQQASLTAADSPLYGPEGLGEGLPGVNFNARPWLYLSDAPLLALVSGSDVAWSAVVVVRIPAATLQEGFVISFRAGGGLVGALHCIGVTVVAGELFWQTIRRGDSGGGVTLTASEPIDTSIDANYVIVFRFDGAACEMLVNGELVLEGEMDVGGFTPTAFVVGAIDDGGDFEWPGGQVGEVVLFGGVAIRPVTRMHFAGFFEPYRQAS